ncbi:MAG: ABC transporter permease, partial [Frankia sp.]
MNRAYRAEMLKLRRPATLAGIGLVAALSVLATSLTFALAKTGAPKIDDNGFTESLGSLARPGGLTAGFVGAMTLAGLLVLVVMIVSMTSEYSQGTLRTVLVVQPRRGAWLVGKFGALLTVVTAAVVVALATSVVTAVIAAEIRGVDTSAWFTTDALSSGAGNFLNAWLAAAFFGAVGVALGVLVRSTAVALAIGVAWAFPLEHIIQNAWAGATHVFPGLLFSSLALGGVPDAGYRTALLAGLAYAV